MTEKLHFAMSRVISLSLVATLIGLCTSCARAPADDPRLDDVALEAIDWLSRHQEPDGSWSSAAFDLACDADGEICTGLAGSAVHDVGVTALATLAILASPTGIERHHSEADAALAWLVEQQAEDGNFGMTHVFNHTYDHAIATLTLARAMALEERADLAPVVERACEYLASVRTPQLGWRYADYSAEMRSRPSDTSVTSWAVHALVAAQRVGMTIDETALEQGLDFIVKMSDDDDARAVDEARRAIDEAYAELDRVLRIHDDSAQSGATIDAQRKMIADLERTEPDVSATGRVGYYERGGLVSRIDAVAELFPWTKSEACTAAALSCRLGVVGDTKALDPAHVLMIKRCFVLRPTVDDPERFDAYGWHYAAVAFAHPIVPASTGNSWRQALADTLVAMQRTEGCARGSFDPHRFAWGSAGGRVYQTAILALAAQAHRGRHLTAER